MAKAVAKLSRGMFAMLAFGASALSHAQAFTVAVPESYSIAPGQTLNIGSGGVLTNDIYSGPVTVNVVANTLHGTLTLQTDGNFTYVPDANYIGPDRFEYELLDSRGNLSNLATDYIAVGAVNNITYDSNPQLGASTTDNGYVSLNYAPASPVTISIKSSNTALVTVPATVNTIAGHSYGKFPMTIKAVSVNTPVIISASYNDVVFSTTLNLVTPSPSILYLSPNSATGGDGNTVMGQVNIYGTAPTAGLVVDIFNSNTAVATAPTSVKIAAGQNFATFPITTKIVSNTRRVTFTVSTPGGSVSNVLVLQPFTFYLAVVGSAELFQESRVSQPAIIGGTDPEHKYNTATVTLTMSSTAPPGGLTLPIYTDCQIDGISAPTTLTVPAGKTSASFKMSLTGYAPSQTSLNVYTYFLSGSAYAGAFVYPPLPLIALDDDDYEFGGTLFPALVSLEGFAPPGGARVALTSSSPYAPVAASVLIPAGANFAEVDIKSVLPASFQAVALTASYMGYTASDSFVLLTPQVDQLVLSSYAVKGGTSVTGTIYLDGVAGAAGQKVNLTYAPTGLLGPASVTVPAGKSSVSFTMTTKAVTKNTNVTIHAYTWAENDWGDTESIELEP